MRRCTPELQSQGTLSLPPNGLPCPPSSLPFQVLCPIADSFSEGFRVLPISLHPLFITESQWDDQGTAEWRAGHLNKR